ncbi:MAG: M23 family metallopeptidase [Alphaproteobacteria bacterium]
MRRRAAISFFFGLAALAFVPALGARGEDAVRLDGKLVQGGLVRGIAPARARVMLDGAAVPATEDGQFLLGFGRDHPARSVLEVHLPGGASLRRALDVEQRSYDIRRVAGLPARMVSPDAEGLQRIAADRARIARARAASPTPPLFASGFAWPAIGPVSGIFGSQSIMNGEARAPHNGVDVAAPTGAPGGAMADGIVLLAEHDMYLIGQSVLLDHGLGLNSVYIHLSEIVVAPGARVAKGQIIGRVGGTGRVTAPHLHWGVNLGQIALDPALLVGPMPSVAQ